MGLVMAFGPRNGTEKLCISRCNMEIFLQLRHGQPSKKSHLSTQTAFSEIYLPSGTQMKDLTESGTYFYLDRRRLRIGIFFSLFLVLLVFGYAIPSWIEGYLSEHTFILILCLPLALFLGIRSSLSYFQKEATLVLSNKGLELKDTFGSFKIEWSTVKEIVDIEGGGNRSLLICLHDPATFIDGAGFLPRIIYRRNQKKLGGPIVMDLTIYSAHKKDITSTIMAAFRESKGEKPVSKKDSWYNDQRSI